MEKPEGGCARVEVGYFVHPSAPPHPSTNDEVVTSGFSSPVVRGFGVGCVGCVGFSSLGVSSLAEAEVVNFRSKFSS